MPATPPVRNATVRASARLPLRAAAAVRTLPRVASVMPMKPVNPDARQPRMKAIVRNAPDWAKLNASVPSVFSIAVDVRNTIAASGTRITAIVRNWRLR